MAAVKHPTFRSWLSSEIDKQNIPRRELARRLAAKHPKGVTTETIETYRRAIYRYLSTTDTMKPNAQTRAAFAEVLGVDPEDIPADDDEESRDLNETLTALFREQVALSRRLQRALKAHA